MTIHNTIKIIIALIIAKFIADQVMLKNLPLVFAIFAVILLFFYLSSYYKFIIFSLTVFFPLSMPYKFPLPMDQWVQLIAPLFCFLFLLDILTNRKPLLSQKALIYFIAIGVLLLWSAVNYIKNPVLGSITFGTEYGKGGLRSYYKIFSGVTIFFYCFWFVRYRGMNVNQLLKLIVVLTFTLGLLRIASYFGHFSIPFLGGMFSWHMGAGAEEVGYQRIGGLGGTAALGIAAFLAYQHGRKWNPLAIFLFISYLIYLFFSGSRMGTFSVFFAVLMYVVLFNKRMSLPLVISGILLFTLLIMANQFVDLSGQKERLSGVTSVSSKSFSTRYYSFRYMWHVFKSDPVFGKGIGDTEVIVDDDFFGPDVTPWDKELYLNFIYGQVVHGGHGGYFSVLSTFGLGGLFFLSVMLFVSIYYAYKIIKYKTSHDLIILAIFCFIYLMMVSGFNVVAGSGYDSPKIWYLAGMVAGLRAKDENTMPALCVKE